MYMDVMRTTLNTAEAFLATAPTQKNMTSRIDVPLLVSKTATDFQSQVLHHLVSKRGHFVLNFAVPVVPNAILSLAFSGCMPLLSSPLDLGSFLGNIGGFWGKLKEFIAW